MRVISLVPSWTETLLACGVDVVGRTRFCVHPPAALEIPVVGGTKDLDLEKVRALVPDLILLDKEENLPWMAGEKTHCTHVESIQDMPRELEALADILGNEKLRKLAVRWKKVIAKPVGRRGVENISAMEWIRRPTQEPEQILYVIWKPWMVVSRETFIGSMLEHLGFGDRMVTFDEKYPKIELSAFDPAKTLLLFSSEPFPFANKKEELRDLPFSSALVDGEIYSWFGIRSLRFLERS